MATESERGFKTVPDFEKDDKGNFIKSEDPVAFFEAKEQRVRERFVNVAQAKILREKVRQCYYKSGVNHYQYVYPQRFIAFCSSIRVKPSCTRTNESYYHHNFYRDCKEIVAAYMKKINSPNFGMQG